MNHGSLDCGASTSYADPESVVRGGLTLTTFFFFFFFFFLVDEVKMDPNNTVNWSSLIRQSAGVPMMVQH